MPGVRTDAHEDQRRGGGIVGVASLERRIEALERLYGGTAYDDTPEGRAIREAGLEAKRAEFKRLLAIGEEKAAREEAEGDDRRRRAMEELKRCMVEGMPGPGPGPERSDGS
jgi:hypothetical protein